jgi:hypothetical protein
LAAFRCFGKGDEVEEQLTRALEANRHVPELLLGRLEMPDVLPDGYTLGSIEEAVFYVLDAGDAWQETPGALDWLEKATSS